MSSAEKMIDTATGASPPWTCTRDVGCSPVHFGSSIQSTSGESFHHSPILLNQEKQKTKENIVVKKIVNNEQTSSLSLPSNYSSSNDTTPVLSSTSSIKPISLMSLELNGEYGFGTTRESSSTTSTNNRWWPIDRPSRRNYKHHQRRLRNNRNNHVQQSRGYGQRSSMITTGNCHHNHYHATNVCEKCCNCHHHC